MFRDHRHSVCMFPGRLWLTLESCCQASGHSCGLCNDTIVQMPQKQTSRSPCNGSTAAQALNAQPIFLTNYISQLPSAFLTHLHFLTLDDQSIAPACNQQGIHVRHLLASCNAVTGLSNQQALEMSHISCTPACTDWN